MNATVVVAIGGHALISDATHMAIPDQYVAVCRLAAPLATVAGANRPLVVTHGNGPQVGFILRRSELAAGEVAPVPIDYAVGDTQGAIGHMFLLALRNELRARAIDRPVVAIVTQTLVDASDPAFGRPTKPVGAPFDERTARAHAASYGWTVAEDPPHGWRRLVASPEPKAILELDTVRRLLASGAIVVAVGGGGIPVSEADDGSLHGVEAVVDKDLASALLAHELDAAALVIPTSVDRVATGFGTVRQSWLDRLSVAEARELQSAGEFAAGSMGPKIEALLRFVEGGSSRAGIVTSPGRVHDALEGRAGTRLTRD